MPSKTFTTYQIAKFCDVAPSSVIHWINGGKLKAYLTPGGHHRVTPDDARAFFKEFGIPVPRQLQSEKKVLIVDDDQEMAGALQRAFDRHPEVFKTAVCHTGVDALITIGESIPDLLVLDLVLPRMDGAQVCSILKAKPQTGAIKIIGISGQTILEQNRLGQYELDAFLPKPLDVLELVARAAKLLDVELRPQAGEND